MAEQGLKNTKASKVREDSKGFLFKVAFFLPPVKIEHTNLRGGRKISLWEKVRDMGKLGSTLPEFKQIVILFSFLKCIFLLAGEQTCRTESAACISQSQCAIPEGGSVEDASGF